MLKWLANGPRRHAMSYTGYIINGKRFHISDVDKVTQNSGKATTICRSSAKDVSQQLSVVTYYGFESNYLSGLLYFSSTTF